MHEIAIAQRVVEEAKKQGAKSKFIVEVGELNEITKNELDGALKQATDMDFEIKEKESNVKCDCGNEGRAKIVDRGHGYCVYNCAKCEGKVEVLEGKDLKILGVE
jgi:Zn finger protein HypA/HybF involved in hydrogenase expression